MSSSGARSAARRSESAPKKAVSSMEPGLKRLTAVTSRGVAKAPGQSSEARRQQTSQGMRVEGDGFSPFTKSDWLLGGKSSSVNFCPKARQEAAIVARSRLHSASHSSSCAAQDCGEATPKPWFFNRWKIASLPRTGGTPEFPACGASFDPDLDCGTLPPPSDGAGDGAASAWPAGKWGCDCTWRSARSKEGRMCPAGGPLPAASS
mmetsp:Transcript_101761/g.217899  ORF Transcript_101761/g.217899 Transcript_101761/m.217899 type:complete len:206 (+) Transcript_101761:1270-1887(+)